MTSHSLHTHTHTQSPAHTHRKQICCCGVKQLLTSCPALVTHSRKPPPTSAPPNNTPRHTHTHTHISSHTHSLMKIHCLFTHTPLMTRHSLAVAGVVSTHTVFLLDELNDALQDVCQSSGETMHGDCEAREHVCVCVCVCVCVSE